MMIHQWIQGDPNFRQFMSWESIINVCGAKKSKSKPELEKLVEGLPQRNHSKKMTREAEKHAI